MRNPAETLGPQVSGSNPRHPPDAQKLESKEVQEARGGPDAS